MHLEMKAMIEFLANLLVLLKCRRWLQAHLVVMKNPHSLSRIVRIRRLFCFVVLHLHFLYQYVIVVYISGSFVLGVQVCGICACGVCLKEFWA